MALAADPTTGSGSAAPTRPGSRRPGPIPASRVLVVAGTRVRPVDEALHWVSPSEAPGDGTRVLLGERDGRVWFALVLDPGDADGDEWVGLRGLLPHLAGDAVEQAPLVFHAIGLAEWLLRHPALPALRRPAGGRGWPGTSCECVECHRRQFPRTDPAVIMAITARRARVDGRGAACSDARTPGRRAATPRWPASWSRARRSRTPYAARSRRRPASWWTR